MNAQNAPPPDLLTARQAAELCGLNPADLRRRVIQGVAPPPDVVDESAPPQRRNPRWSLATIARWNRVRHRTSGRYARTPQNLFAAILESAPDPRRPWAVVDRRTGAVVNRLRTEDAARGYIVRMDPDA